MRLKTQLLFLVVILALFSVEESFAKRRGGGSRGGSRSRSSSSSRGWYVFFTLYYLYDSCTLQTHPCNENRVFPVKIFSQGKICFHYREPCSHCGDPVFITGTSL